jgi:hypothetical protein
MPASLVGPGPVSLQQLAQDLPQVAYLSIGEVTRKGHTKKRVAAGICAQSLGAGPELNASFRSYPPHGPIPFDWSQFTTPPTHCGMTL